MEDFYDLLEVSRDASIEEINRAWRRKVRRYHPDVNDDARATAQFKTLKKAHEVLSDETERAAYDRMGHVKYVNQRLDGLPTGPSRPGETDTTKNRETDNRRQTGESGQHGTQSGTNRATGTRQQNTSTSQRFGHKKQRNRGSGSERTHSERTSSTAASGTNTTTSGTGRRSQTGDADQSETNATAASATKPKRRASPLLYGWIGVVFAGAVYLAGLWQYLTANATTLATLRRAALSDPMTALTGTFDLVGPAGFAFAATLDAPPSLLFPIGVVALAVALVAVVLTFGRGFAYLYAIGGITPLLALAADTTVALPDGIVLVLVGLCPLVATTGFVVDVGRVALASHSPRS